MIFRGVIKATALAGTFAVLSGASPSPEKQLPSVTAPPKDDPSTVASAAPPGPEGLTTSSNSPFSGNVPAALLLRVPVSGVVPGDRAVAPEIKNPLESDPDASTRGMKAFDTFNCSGCHAANGAGAMGPALSNDAWIYRSSPANIYLTIVQGRAKGMPAFGTLLPERVVWELVSYIQSIAEKPSGQFGKTISAQPLSPDREQVSANRLQTPTPWRYTEPAYPGEKPK